MKSERELFKATLIDIGYHESAFSFDSQTGMYTLEMTQENWRIWQASASREGYKLVPVEPTDKMLSAASGFDIVANQHGEENVLWNGIREDWKAMIGAADD